VVRTWRGARRMDPTVWLVFVDGNPIGSER